MLIDVNTLFGPHPTASSEMSVDDLIAMLQKHQISKACTLSTLGGVFDANLGNTATRAACSEHPELIPVATVNPTTYFSDPEPIYKLKQDGFKMVRLFPADQGWPINFAPFSALVHALKVTGLPLMIRVGKLGEISDLMRVLEGFTAPLVLEGVDITLLPEAISAMKSHGNWYVETSNLLASGAIGRVAEIVGAQRILLGTGAPFHPIAGVMNTIRLARFSEADSALVLGGNAARLLQ